MLFFLAFTVSAIISVEYPQVTLPQARYIGNTKSKTTTFLGVPFALSPTGSRRFRPPYPINTTSTEIVDATNYGPACIPKPGITKGTSEDCLNLDIYTPSTSGNFPVIVYIFGGGFEGGSSNSDGLYNGARIVNDFPEVVIVSINYRVGIFGWIAGPAVEDTGMLNNGLLDQRMAFDWIKKNIAAFGGDPNRITAMGQSAGAISIGLHLLADKGRQEMFQRAIMLSGAAGIGYATVNQRKPDFVTILEVTGCSRDDSEAVMECLRSSSLDTLVKAGVAATGFGPTLDGRYMVDTLAALRAGEFSKVDIIMNTNSNEGKLPRGYLDNGKMDTFDDFIARVKLWWNGSEKEQSENLEIYNPEKYNGNFKEAFSQFFSDLIFKCPASFFSRAYEQAGLNVYVSRFTYVPALLRLVGNWGKDSFHGADLIFVFQNRKLMAPFEWPMARRISKSYVEFAKGNRPSDLWERYGSAGRRYDVFKKTMVVDDDISSKQCMMFESAAVSRAGEA